MKKQELVAAAVRGLDGISKNDATVFVDQVFETLKQATVAEERVAYPGFGTFVLRHRKARDGHDPRTGKKIRIKASKTVAFRPASAFKDSL